MPSLRDVYDIIDFIGIINQFPINLIWQTYEMGVNLTDINVCDYQSENKECQFARVENESSFITTFWHIDSVSMKMVNHV